MASERGHQRSRTRNLRPFESAPDRRDQQPPPPRRGGRYPMGNVEAFAAALLKCRGDDLVGEVASQTQTQTQMPKGWVETGHMVFPPWSTRSSKGVNRPENPSPRPTKSGCRHLHGTTPPIRLSARLTLDNVSSPLRSPEIEDGSGGSDRAAAVSGAPRDVRRRGSVARVGPARCIGTELLLAAR
jgi:hypothetical protein